MRSATAFNAAVSLDEILSRPDVWCADRLATAPIPTVTSGFTELDAELPGGGWPRGSLTEILVERVGIGECSLLLPALDRMRAEQRWTLLIAPPYRIHGPGWANGGVDLSRLVVVAPNRAQDALWAAEHALASGVFGTVANLHDFLFAQQLDCSISQITDDRLDVAAYIANFGELGRFNLDERRVGQLGQATGDFGFTDTGRADHQDVFWRDFNAQFFGQLHPAPAVAQGNGYGALGIVLADDMAVEFMDDFAGSHGHSVWRPQA